MLVANLKNDILGIGGRKEFVKERVTLIVPVGSKGGVAEMGDLGGLLLWSWVVWLCKEGFFMWCAWAISGFKKM